MTPRLVPWPRAAAAVIAACVLLVAGLGAFVYRDSRGTGFDDAVERWIARNVGPSALDAMLHLTDPPLIIGLVAAVALVSLLLRRWEVAALVVATPVAAVLLTEEVLKPLVHRTNGVLAQSAVDGPFAYPSGHETALAGLVAVLGLLLVRSRVGLGGKIGGLVVLGAVLVLAAFALVGLYFHFVTDAIAAVGVAVGCMLALGLLIDAVYARMRTPTRVS